MIGFTRRSASSVLVVLTAFVLAVTGAPAASAEPPAFVLRDGVSQPVFSYQNAIRETAWVETGQDLDRDGRIDRVAADIIRPAEPAARGRRVPVIMDVSPYYACCGRGNENQKKTYAADGTPEQFPLFYDNYFVPRGYAVVLVDVGGTNRSSGCFDDVASGNAVVNWLNGRARGFRSPAGQDTVKAGWANGAVGAIGKSQDGTTAIGMAASGIDGLKTVVPIESVSDNYAQHIANGSPIVTPENDGSAFTYNERAAQLCQPYEQDNAARAGTNGDYNEYWKQLNYAANAKNVHASVFSVQGFQDGAVAPNQFTLWWDAIGRAGVTRKAWLSQAGHTDPFDLQREQWVATLHRWFDRWLLGVRNGIEREPAIHLEQTPGQWVDLPQWPAATRQGTLWPSAGGTLANRPGVGTATVVDDPAIDREQWATQDSTARAVFTTDPLTRPERLSGTPSVTVTASSDKPVARLGVALVDYGPASTRNTVEYGSGIKNLDTRSCWGESSAADSACFLDTTADLVDVDHVIVAVGWADLGHYASLEHGVALTPGTPYTITFPLTGLDHVVPAGHRLGLIVGGTDAMLFDPALPRLDDTLTFTLAATSVTLPLAG
ncbi:CocE/NonD family hydrolase [Amycolatopsis taiwanensis]|uniref:X-Pro dipeptidyl-peptidase n=1 Tax=Amycolatopsis taiwanensis TaxID=342230 RepID=A0A9W6VIU0_9PSEU|nr:CocE/NonD family hydrolase [Amycolatopsis taiwanensis]GLY68797.1 X-Pro dipeptidyl-peptidase [Amycolatopsis taiwanensis]